MNRRLTLTQVISIAQKRLFYGSGSSFMVVKGSASPCMVVQHGLWCRRVIMVFGDWVVEKK